MPGVRCAVSGCNNSYLGVQAKGEDVKFFSFPKPSNFVLETVYHEWITRCRRPENFNPKHSRICSIHFTDDDFERDLKNELLGLPLKKKLKKTAIPTLFLPLPENYEEDEDELYDNKEFVQEQLKFSDGETFHQSVVVSLTEKDERLPTSVEDAKSQYATSVDYEALYRELLVKYNDNLNANALKLKGLSEKYDVLKAKYLELRRNSSQKMKMLQDQLRYYKRNYQRT